MIDKNLSQKIVSMKNADLQLRGELLQKGALSNGYSKDMESLHNKNARMLSEIIDNFGFPTVDNVGIEASEAAWLVIQHAIGMPSFMQKCLGLLEKAVSENKASPIRLAYLQDRIDVLESKPQRYGTQFDWDESGNLSPSEVDDWIKVNERRKMIGLDTMENQIESIRNRVKAENQTPPTDFKNRKQEMDKWRKKVGWIK